ncbi:MAG TPA: cohesin domain-containing protein [Patescibacteria group bacterium]|jgi:flagellar basal body-associated protein FliL|nr:cohesin domain-containing protein [Patescibacteria group bacterium]
MENEEKITTTEVKNPVPEVPVTSPMPVEKKSGWMPRKTLILIIVLVIITIGLLAIALLPNIKSPISVRLTPAPSTPSYAQTELSFSAPVSTTLNNYSTDVLISTGDNKTTAVQLEISYDPKILTNVSITPGTFLTNPVVLLKKIDAVNGTISYALGINPSQKPTNGSGTVATVTFSAVATAAATQTPINFEPKTEATAVGYSQSVLGQSTGVLFTLPAIPTP